MRPWRWCSSPSWPRGRPASCRGGQQQRVALARALVNRPRVLLLDEPLGALDLKLRKEMQLELKHLQTGLGITFLYVTHDQEEALTMSDRIVLMRQGGVAQIGTPRDLYDRPASRYVADFIGETNLLPARWSETRDGGDPQGWGHQAARSERLGAGAGSRGLAHRAPRGDRSAGWRLPPAGWNARSGNRGGHGVCRIHRPSARRASRWPAVGGEPGSWGGPLNRCPSDSDLGRGARTLCR